ncbi:MAG: choice-of-anchor J domain-containing protein [Paludibacteraceae bacterium]|nr:choice-of-anchor J domain-containing protein [Paludibacteraceae bacterium]
MKKLVSLLTVLSMALVPLSADDELLSNAGFELSQTGTFGTEFTDWDIPLGMTAAETTDKVEGAQALKTVEVTLTKAYVQQAVSTLGTDLQAGDTCEVRIRYKVLTAQPGGDICLDCYWEHSRDGELKHDSVALRTQPFTADVWSEKNVRTTVPEGASRFNFRVGVTKKSVVLLDDCSFRRVANATTEPRLTVTPTALNSVSAAINTTANMTPLTIRQANLTTPITLEITGANRNCFSLSTNSITAAEAQVVVSYHPTTVGTHKATLIIESSNHPELSQTISLTGKSYDPAQPPTLSIAPANIAPFTAAVNADSSITVQLTSTNCIDYVYAKVEHLQGAAFTINNSMFTQNTTVPVRITFHPTAAGTYSSRITFSSDKADDVAITVTGTATGTAGTADYDSTFVWTMDNPRTLLVEPFSTTDHNHTIALDGWQNVVLQGQRPWWGFADKDAQDNIIDHYAKATAYVWQQTEDEPWEMWLVTPPLDYLNAASQLFTFRVMGNFMFEGHSTVLEVYYIDTIPDKGLYKQKLDIDIPADKDQNGEWYEFHLDLAGQNIADVFFMAFRFAGNSGNANSTTYYIDDVSWGRTDIPTLNADSASVIMTATKSTAIASTPITVTTKNLTEPIKLTIGGANAGRFELSTNTLPTSGGQFTVAFESDTEGVHEAYIKLASRGAADKYIALSVLVKAATGLNAIDNDCTYVWADNATLHIHSDEPHNIVVHDAAGRCIWQQHTSTATLPAAAGIYFVAIDNRIVKIVVP